MRNQAILAAVALMAGVGMVSCQTDTDPKAKLPTEFILNTPPMADQVYYFSCDGKGKPTNDITFTVSQPNYGVGTPPTYTIQLARSAADFEAWDAQQAFDAENGTVTVPEEGELPLAIMVDQTFKGANITVPGDKFCEALNTLYGFERKTYQGEIVPVYVRAHAQLGDAAYTGIWSTAGGHEPVKLAGVRSYFKLVKGTLYIVGEFQGWNIEASDYFITETEIGSNIYKGKVDIPRGEKTFLLRFYSELGNWEANSWGSQVPDANVDLNWSAVEGAEEVIMSGKGNYRVANWAGGEIAIEVNLNEDAMYVKFTPPMPNMLYVVGACSGWNIKGTPGYELIETTKNSGIYEGTFDVKAGEATFKIYGPEAIEAGNWDIDHYGAAIDDGNNAINLVGGEYKGSCVDGKGNWDIQGWTGGKLFIHIDTNDMTVIFKQV